MISVAAFSVTGESPVATVKIPSVSEEHTGESVQSLCVVFIPFFVFHVTKKVTKM